MRATCRQGCDALQLGGIPHLAPLLSFSSSVLHCWAGWLHICLHPALQEENNTPRFYQVHWCFGTDGLHYPQAKSQPPQVSSFKRSCSTTNKINHTLAQHCVVNPTDQIQSWQASLLNSSQSMHNYISKAEGRHMCNKSQGFWHLLEVTAPSRNTGYDLENSF